MNSYSFWVSDKQDEIISIGRMRAINLKQAKGLFKDHLLQLRKDGIKIGDSYLDNEPEGGEE